MKPPEEEAIKKELPDRILELTCGTEREETMRDLAVSLSMIMGLFMQFFIMNGLPIPGVIAEDMDKQAGLAREKLDKLEKGAVIYGGGTRFDA